MTHSNNSNNSNNRQTRIQSDRRTHLQADRRDNHPAASSRVTNRDQDVYDREIELADQDMINRNPSVGNGGNGDRNAPNNTALNNSYQNGYTRRAYEENLRTRDDNNASRGLLMGVLLTSLLGIAIGALFFVNQQSQTPAVVPVPAEPEATDTETNNTQIRERVIERTRELVPVPQPQAPAPQQPEAESAPPTDVTQPEVQPEVTQPEAVQPEVVQPEVTQPVVPSADPANPPTS